MKSNIKIFGKTRNSPNDNCEKVVCFVSYSDASSHRSIVEDSFQYHLGLDLEYMSKNFPSHFTEPHNVGRAILLYHYFRKNHQFFNDESWEHISSDGIPNRSPDAAGENYELWIEKLA